MKAGSETHWQEPQALTAAQLRNLAPEYPRFCGSLLYTFKLTADRIAAWLDLGTVGELASVTVNGIPCGALVSAPFRFRVANA